jgi:hypothetical protein
MKTRPCLGCGARAEHLRPSDGDYHQLRCSAQCGREVVWGHTEPATADAWNMINEPVSEAQDRARREARERIGRKGEGK